MTEGRDVDWALAVAGAEPAGCVPVAATELIAHVTIVGQRDVLLDGDLIETKANQLGLLGFGSSTDNGYHAEFAGSAAILINRGLAFGGEYRTMPRDLKSVGRASNYAYVYVAYFPTKHFSVTAAYAFLGQVAPAVDNAGSSTKNENGVYISGQLAF